MSFIDLQSTGTLGIEDDGDLTLVSGGELGLADEGGNLDLVQPGQLAQAIGCDESHRIVLETDDGFVNIESGGNLRTDEDITYVELTIASGTVDSDLTDFKVFVDLSDMPERFWDTVHPDGRDIRVVQDGTLVPVDLVKFEPDSQVGHLFFKDTVATASSTSWHIRWNYSGYTQLANDDTYGQHAVWSDKFDFITLFSDTDFDRAGGAGRFDEIAGDPTFFEVAETSPDVNAAEGVCYDGEYYYVTDTNALRKYDKDWNLITETNDPCGDTGITGVNRAGDPEYRDGKIYVPVEEYPNSPYDNQHIAVFRAGDLAFETSYDISAQAHECGSIAYNEDDGYLWICDSTDTSTLYKYSLTGEYIGSQSVTWNFGTGQFVRGLVFWRGALWVASNTYEEILRIDLSDFSTSEGGVYGATGYDSFGGLSKTNDGLLVVENTGTSEVVNLIRPRRMALAPGGTFNVATDARYANISGLTTRSSFTLGASFSLDDVVQRCFISYIDGPWVSGNDRVSLTVDSGNDIGVWDGSSGNGWLLSGVDPGTDTPTRVHTTYDGTTERKIYVNGNLEGTDSSITANSDSDTLEIGREDGDSNEHWRGEIGFVYVANTVLTADWIKAEYDNINDTSTFYSISDPALADEVGDGDVHQPEVISGTYLYRLEHPQHQALARPTIDPDDLPVPTDPSQEIFGVENTGHFVIEIPNQRPTTFEPTVTPENGDLVGDPLESSRIESQLVPIRFEYDAGHWVNKDRNAHYAEGFPETEEEDDGPGKGKGPPHNPGSQGKGRGRNNRGSEDEEDPINQDTNLYAWDHKYSAPVYVPPAEESSSILFSVETAQIFTIEHPQHEAEFFVAESQSIENPGIGWLPPETEPMRPEQDDRWLYPYEFFVDKLRPPVGWWPVYEDGMLPEQDDRNLYPYVFPEWEVLVPPTELEVPLRDLTPETEPMLPEDDFSHLYPSVFPDTHVLVPPSDLSPPILNLVPETEDVEPVPDDTHMYPVFFAELWETTPLPQFGWYAPDTLVPDSVEHDEWQHPFIFRDVFPIPDPVVEIGDFIALHAYTHVTEDYIVGEDTDGNIVFVTGTPVKLNPPGDCAAASSTQVVSMYAHEKLSGSDRIVIVLGDGTIKWTELS